MNSKEEVKKLNLQGIEIELPFPVVVEEDIVSLSSVLKKEFEIIKQSLDRLGQLEKERQEVETRLSGKETNTFDEIATMIKKANDYDVLVSKCEKFEKALDILISKKVDVNQLKTTKDFNGYNRIRHFYEADYLQQEEYELLKEVLNCE